MKPTRRRKGSLASETGMLLSTPCPLIFIVSYSYICCCSARVRRWLRFLVYRGGGLACKLAGEVDMLSNNFDSMQLQGVCWSAAHLPSVSKSYHLCLQLEWRHTSLVRLGPLWFKGIFFLKTCKFYMFYLFLKRTAYVFFWKNYRPKQRVPSSTVFPFALGPGLSNW